MERLNGEKDEGRKARKQRSGRACVPDFWSRSMIFPKRTNEGGGLRMAAMELDLAGGRMANRVAQSWKMRLCVLESHSPACISPCARRILVSSSSSLHSSVLRKYVSIHIYARSCYTVRPNNTRVRRSISIWLPEMRLTGPCGFVRITRKNMARVRVRMELYSPLSGWYQTRFLRWSTVSPMKW